LTAAVYDRNPGRVLPPRPVVENPRRHGLSIVAALTQHRGHQRHQREVRLGSCRPRTRAIYPAEVRKAAHDAVRTALMHGVSSPYATLAVRWLVNRLTDERGPESDVRVRGRADHTDALMLR
jgi:hypothetical protein